MAIDGCGASGKSTLARGPAQAADDVTVVEFDDFYLPLVARRARVARGDVELGGNFDWRRLRDHVLAPLSRDESGEYQRYVAAEDSASRVDLVLDGAE